MSVSWRMLLLILAGFVLVWLLLKGSVYALPCIAGWCVARFAFETGAGWIGSGIVWIITALAVFFLMRWLYAIAGDPVERVAVTCAHVGPAVVMAYSIFDDLSAGQMSSETWRQALCVVGAGVVGLVAFVRLAEGAE